MVAVVLFSLPFQSLSVLLTQLPRELPIEWREVLRRSFAKSCRAAAVAGGRWLVIAVVLLGSV